VERSQCRDRGDVLEIEARGFTHDPSTGTVRVVDANDPGRVFGTDAVILDVAPFGVYDADIEAIRDGPCPELIRVELVGTGAFTEIAPDIRVDGADAGAGAGAGAGGGGGGDPAAEVLTIVEAQFRTDRSEWRVEGTSNLVNGNTITIFVGATTGGTQLGIAVVDPVDGTFDFRQRNSPVGQNNTITIQSSFGNTQSLAVEIRN
jgi:hypothetical protein